MRVAVLLAGLAAAYATNDAAPIDKTVSPEITQFLRNKECVLNDASEAYANALVQVNFLVDKCQCLSFGQKKARSSG
jgi:hypothetical protein